MKRLQAVLQRFSQADVIDLGERRIQKQRKTVQDTLEKVQDIMSEDPGFQRPGIGEFWNTWEEQGLLAVLKKFQAERNDLDLSTRDDLVKRLRHEIEHSDSSFNVMDDQIVSFQQYAKESGFSGFGRGQGPPEGWRSVFFSNDAERIDEAFTSLDPRDLSPAAWREGLREYDRWKEAVLAASRAVHIAYPLSRR